MDQKKLTLLVVALLLLGAFVFALTQWTSGATSTVQPPTADSTMAQGEAGQATTWAKRCDEPKAQGEKAHCEIFQKLVVKDSNQRVIEFAVSKREDGQWVAAILLPLGISVEGGGLVHVDQDDKAEKFPIRACSANGCFARFIIKPEFMQKLRSAQQLYVTFSSMEGKVIRVGLSMDGFNQSLTAISP